MKLKIEYTFDVDITEEDFGVMFKDPHSEFTKNLSVVKVKLWAAILGLDEKLGRSKPTEISIKLDK